ncbi:gamma-glutamyltransferase [Permianibacter sp. IMCC34836]|uniref:gamma-glutamyltransferase n=1 Tax=Permianibacter fluminis TaxID=2738515 RepID=UPI001551EF78|nr:gamma-glutamyltransferase [Permianibacter fluminis]NQD35877.1 gamma-glutamyltransferase [Permianibacter fluminis]
MSLRFDALRAAAVALYIALPLASPQAVAADSTPQARFELANVFSPTLAKRGMVVSEEEIASQIGADMLARGGNAVDAAVAVGFALAVVLPEAGNIGGGGFMLVHLAKANKTIAIDYRELAPNRAQRDMYLNADGSVNHDELGFGYKGVGVPGTVAGMVQALEKYGTLKLKDVLAPAIKLAREGFVLKPAHEESFANARDRFLRNDESRRIFLKADGSNYQFGDKLVQKDLAWSLEQIAKQGPQAFYGGVVGQKLIADIQAHGGIMTLEDLQQYRVVEREPVRGAYRGYEVVSMPPPSSGGIHLIQILNVLEGYPVKDWGLNSSKTMHVMIEAERRAYADRSRYLGDPDFVTVPVAQLTDKRYAEKIRSQISLDKATPSAQVAPGDLKGYESPQTTHYSVMDQWGNAVANTYTLNWSYGTGITAKGTGILLNNEMDDFSAKPGVANAYGLLGEEANAVAARKRPLSSMTPTFVMKDGKVMLVTGSPGGSTIITTVLQIVMNVVDHDLNIATASSVPRFHSQWQPDRVRLEFGFAADTIDALKAKGHDIRVGSPLGTTESIVFANGWFQGAADPRRAGGGAIGVQ